LIKEFEQREVIVRRQVGKDEEYKRMELPGKYTAKLLYRWDDGKFEGEYLKKLKRNWRRWKEDRKSEENKQVKTIEEKMEEENKKIRGRDWTTGHFSRGEILRGG